MTGIIILAFAAVAARSVALAGFGLDLSLARRQLQLGELLGHRVGHAHHEIRPRPAATVTHAPPTRADPAAIAHTSETDTRRRARRPGPVC